MFEDQTNAFEPVYTPDQGESLNNQALAPFTFSERMRNIWQSQTDSDAGSSLMSETVLTPIAQRARRVGPKITAQEANKLYPVDLPYIEDIHEAEAKFLYERNQTRGRYGRIAAETPWYELFPGSMAANVAIDLPFYAAFNVAAAGANAVLQGTRIGMGIARARTAIEGLGKSGALGKIAQVGLLTGLEEAGEELAFAPLKSLNSASLMQSYTLSDVAQDVGEGFVGGALLGGALIGPAMVGYSKIFNKTRAKDVITRAEADISSGFIPPTEQQLKQADSSVFDAIPPDDGGSSAGGMIEAVDPTTDVDSDFYAGIELNNGGDLESSSIPFEGAPFSGTEFTVSQKIAAALGGNGIAHVKLGDAKLLDLSQPLAPEVSSLLFSKIKEVLGKEPPKELPIDNSTFIEYSNVIYTVAPSLHAEFEQGLKDLGYDGVSYTSGGIGEGGKPTEATAHKAVTIFKGQEGKLKPQAIKKVQPNEKVLTASSSVDAAHYQKKESIINFDEDIDKKIQQLEKEIQALGEDSLDTLDQDQEMFEATDAEVNAYVKVLTEKLKLTDKLLDINSKIQTGELSSGKVAVNVKLGVNMDSLKTIDEAKSLLKVGKDGAVTNHSEIMFYHGGAITDVSNFEAFTKSTYDIFYGMGLYASSIVDEAFKYASLSKNKDKPQVHTLKTNKALKIFNPDHPAVKAKLLKAFKSFVKNTELGKSIFSEYALKANGIVSIRFALKSLGKDSIKGWELYTAELQKLGIDGFIIPNRVSFTGLSKYQLELVVFQTAEYSSLQKKIAAIDKKNVEAIKKVLEDNKPVTKDQLSSYMQNILFCTKRGP